MRRKVNVNFLTAKFNSEKKTKLKFERIIQYSNILFIR